jgi:ParB/RepB/Spo0J family partition protein
VAKKRTSLSQTLFSGIDPYGQAQAEAGETESRLRYLPLTAVRPDPDQPRRLLPGNLQAQLAEPGRYDPLATMANWLAQAPPHDGRLQELRQLADSIARHGLINPITVRPAAPPVETAASPTEGRHYFIVTGERRYWAHVLLALEQRRLQVGDQTDPHQVQALLAPDGISIRAHQLIENINREDINAVEKAYGLVALRRELSEVNPGSPPTRLVPWTEVSDTLGISKRYRIYLTAVLDLSDEAQAIITAHSMAEKTVRPIVQKLKDRPQLQVEALQQIVAWQRENEAEEGPERAISNKAVGDLVKRLLAREDRSARQPRVPIAPHTQNFQNNVRRTLRFLNRLEADDLVLVARDLALDQTYAETVTELQTLHDHLEEVLRRVEDYRANN